MVVSCHLSSEPDTDSWDSFHFPCIFWDTNSTMMVEWATLLKLMKLSLTCKKNVGMYMVGLFRQCLSKMWSPVLFRIIVSCSMLEKQNCIEHMENCNHSPKYPRVTTWVTYQVWICHYSGNHCWTNGNLTPRRILHGAVFCFLLSFHWALISASVLVWSDLCPPTQTHTLEAVVVFYDCFWEKIQCS